MTSTIKRGTTNQARASVNKSTTLHTVRELSTDL
jgi:hypothetical protein